MPDYILIGDLAADLPPQFLTQALDDDGDGTADPGVWTAILRAVSSEIDGILGQRYPVPFGNPLPPIIPHAARTLALATLYRRRGLTENPFANAADAIREKLQLIASGKEPLAPEATQASPAVSTITEPSRLSKSAKLSA